MRLSPRSIRRLATLLLAPFLALSACRSGSVGETNETQPPEAQPGEDLTADLLFRGGPVHTMGPAGTVTAVALRDRHVVWTGDADDAGPWIGPGTQVIEIGDRAVVPGLADAHLHLSGLGSALAEVDLMGTTSYEEVVARVAAAASALPPGTWVTGRGWDQNDWPETRLPHHQALSEAVPDHPVVMRRIGGHALLANASALAAADIGRGAEAPDGGFIHRDDGGAPTGVLIDNAMALMDRVVPPITREEHRRRVKLAVEHLHEQGITAVHDARTSAETIELFGEMARAGELPLRVAVMLAAEDPARLLAPEVTGFPTDDLTGDGLVSVRMIKLSADGALGSRGAAMIEPYTDEPGTRGLVLHPEPYMRQLVRDCLEDGWQLCIHAIGDAANRQVLDLYEAGLDENPVDDHRFRIEHAQVVHPGDLPRFAELGVIPSIQTQHLTSDMPWALDRVGEDRLEGAYAWRTLLDSGVILAGGSDAPVERVDVAQLFHAAVTRRGKDGQPPEGWDSTQAMTPTEALQHVTIWAAQSAFWEDRIGSLEVGKRADVALLSLDPLTCPPEQLAELDVEMTVFDGQVVFPRQTQRVQGAAR